MQELLEHIFSIFNGSNELFGSPLTYNERGVVKAISNNLNVLPEPRDVGQLAYEIMTKMGMSVDEPTAVIVAFLLSVKDSKARQCLESIIMRRLNNKRQRSEVRMIKDAAIKKGIANAR